MRNQVEKLRYLKSWVTTRSSVNREKISQWGGGKGAPPFTVILAPARPHVKVIANSARHPIN